MGEDLALSTFNWRDIPALSIRQPWAWAIMEAGKDIENRTWSTSYRGPVFIHAAKVRDTEAGTAITAISGKASPTDTYRGGLIGIAVLSDVVTQSDSPWFQGPFGFRLTHVRPIPYRQCRGMLGLFKPPPEAANIMELFPGWFEEAAHG